MRCAECRMSATEVGQRLCIVVKGMLTYLTARCELR